MISSLFGVAAAKVNSISETIQSLNPTETLENALKTAPPVSVPSSFPAPQSFNPLTSQPTRPPQPTKPPQPPVQPAPVRNQPPLGLSNSRSTVALSSKSNFPPGESKNNQVYFSPQHTSSSSVASRNESKDAPTLPDLSGLSVEEQRKIREVLERQCDEDASEQQALTRQRQDLEKLEKDVKNLEEQSRSMGIADGSVCQICYRIKFEPASTSTPAGHRCHSCQLKFCASCGHKTQLHTQKLAWQCKICKKKADILARSGKWVSPTKESEGSGNTSSNTENNTDTTPQDHPQVLQHPNEKGLHTPVSSSTHIPPHGSSNVNGEVKPPGPQIDRGNPHNVQPNNRDNRSSTSFSTTQQQTSINNINNSNVANIFSNKQPSQQQQSPPQQHHHQQVNNQVPPPPPPQITSAASSSSSPFTQLAKLLPVAIQPAVLTQSSSNAAQAASSTSVSSNTNPKAAVNTTSTTPGINDASVSTVSSGLGMSSAASPGAPPPLPPPRSSQSHYLKGGSGAAGTGQPLPRRSLTSSANRSGSGKSRLSSSLAPPRRSPPHPPEIDGGSVVSGYSSQSRRSPSGRFPGDSIMSGSGGSRDPDLPDSGYRSESNRTSSSRDSLEKRRRGVAVSEHYSVQPHHSGGGKRHSGSMQKMDSMGSEFSVVNDAGAIYKTSAGSIHYSDLQHTDDASSHQTYHDEHYNLNVHAPREHGVGGAGAGRRHRTPPHHRALDVSASGGGRSFSSSEEDIRSTSDLTSWDGFESESLISDRGFDPWDDFNLGYSSASSRSWRGGAVEWSPNADGFGSLIGRIVMNKGVGRELGLKVRGGQPLDSILTNCAAGVGTVTGSNVSSSSGAQPDKIDLEALAQQYAGVLAALVVNVRRGSPADVTAGLVTGDEILEWNKISFRNLTHNQVTHVIMQSKQETEVELVICRRPFLQLKHTQLNSSGSRSSRSTTMSASAAGALQLVDQVNNNFSSSLPYPPRPTTRRGAGGNVTAPATPASGAPIESTMQHTSSGSGGPPQFVGDVMNGGGNNNSSATNISSSSASALSYSLPASVYRNISSSSSAAAAVLGLSHPNAAVSNNTSVGPPLNIMQPSSECVSGQLQMQLSYSDKENQLTVTLNQAVDLISREGGQARNPYAKIYLFPDRTEDSLRRTKTCFKTLNPIWNQSFSFHVSRNSFPDKELEVTIWDNCFADQVSPGIGVRSSSSQHHSQQQSISASADDFAYYKGGGLAVKEFLGEVLLSLDQALVDGQMNTNGVGEVQWFDLHVHDSSSNHSLPIPSPPPGNVNVLLATTSSTSRQKSAPAYDASSMSYGSGSKFPLNSLWQNNADDSIGAVQIGTMDKILKNVRNFQLPLSLNIPSGGGPATPHQNPAPNLLPFSGSAATAAVTAPTTPVSSFSAGFRRGEVPNPHKDFNNSASFSLNNSPSARAKSTQFLGYIINTKNPQQDGNGAVLRHGLGGTGAVVDGAKLSPGSRSLPNETFNDAVSSSGNVAGPIASVWSQPGSFFNGLLQKVADKTSSWENSDPRLAAQALLSPQAFNKNDHRSEGRDDIFMSRKGATAPSTPMRSETISAAAAAAADYQRLNRVSDGGTATNVRSSYLTSTSSAAIDHRSRIGGHGKRGHREESFGRHSKNYDFFDDHRSPRSNRFISGYHSAGEGYHYVTSSRHSDFGDDRDDLLYATDIEGPAPRHRNSRSAFDNWETRSTSRYSSRSPTYYSDVEATGRRMLRHGKENQQGMGSVASSDVYRSGGSVRHQRASSGRRGSGSSDHFLDQDGSFPRSLPDPRSSHLRGGGSAVANRIYGNTNQRQQQLSSSFNIGGGAPQHQQQPVASAATDQVFRFRRYRGGPASRVRQYNRSTFGSSGAQQQPHPNSAANFWSPQNLKTTSHVTRDRLCHSDVEGDFLSDYEFERGRNLAAFSSNYPYRHASPISTGPSTPTQSFGFPAGAGVGMGSGAGREEQSEHSITPRAGMFSPNEYVNERNIPMRRQSSVQNPPVSPPLRTEQKSLRRQISDALNYFGGSREPLENEQDLDYLSQSDASHLRNQNYERRQPQSERDRDRDRDRGHGDRETVGGNGKHSRESCNSSRFGDESSFDSPISRSTNKAHNLYSPGEFPASYSGETPPRTSKRSRESSSAVGDRSSRDSRSSDKQQYLDEKYNEHSPQTRGDDTSSRGDYLQQPPPRHSRSSKGGAPKSSAASAPGELEPPEMYDDGSGSMDEHQNQNQRGNRNWDRDYHENDLGDTTSNVSAPHGMQHSRGGDEDVEESIAQKANMENNNAHEEEDDIELAFRRGLESEGDLRDDEEDEDDDIDNWLLAQSKKYGVKMEQVDRSEEAEHVLSASMPVGADAGFYSDTGGGFGGVGGKKRRPSIGHKIGALVGLSKKSSSLTQLQDTRNKRISIPRSAEVGFHTHDDMKQYLLSRMDNESIASEASLFLQNQYAMPAEKQLNSFVEDLGPGQVVGRQVLGSPCLGEIQLSIGLKRNTCLEVEIVRARNLTMRPQAKLFPAAFVKVYLMEGKKCCGKAKTKIARRTTDPYFQQQLSFDAAPSGRTLQVTVWGDYGRMERKCFMGVAQINLDTLNLSNIVIGWYKLFTSSSLVEHSKNSQSHGAPPPGFAPSHFSDY